MPPMRITSTQSALELLHREGWIPAGRFTYTHPTLPGIAVSLDKSQETVVPEFLYLDWMDDGAEDLAAKVGTL